MAEKAASTARGVAGSARPAPEAYRAVAAEAERFLLDGETPVDGDRRSRLAAARAEIDATGGYLQTAAELAHGCKLAWRNHARCVGRLHWKALRVVDRRDAVSAEDVFAACVEHLRLATNGGRLQPVITVFAPRGADGSAIRIWNPQLVRYAGYTRTDGSVVGDPLHVGITAAAQALGWRGSGGPFDVLPLIVRLPGEAPRWFELPADAVLEVELVHPEFTWFAGLGLRWHAVPAISDMLLEIGGVEYPAAPFNGWYVGYEIGARNLADTDRYDLLPRIGARLGLDMSREDSLWKDLALVELNRAVLHSFHRAGAHIVDHHTVTRQFVTHEERELRRGRATPTDRDWIVPPLSPSTTPVFHRGYTNTPVRPNFHRQEPAWK
ncbi:nitric oxide synthase oxygenase [Streptomyces sp. NPDC051569]|uniref:nitric oxide synthase oxygenase n=1 Tax=Streptomyces sp. NPDC051569 TaxID=3365661 RepID=UPI0037BDA810